jgi:hypothetical protein
MFDLSTNYMDILATSVYILIKVFNKGVHHHYVCLPQFQEQESVEGSNCSRKTSTL